MKKCIKMLSVIAILCSLTVLAQAAVTFKLGPSLNNYGDSRISGMGSDFTMMFDLDKLSVGYKIEQQNLTVADAQNSANTFLLSNQITALVFEKDVARIGAEFPVNVGLEIGSIQTTCLAGSVAGPAGMNQVSPVLGIYGGVKYDTAGKSINTSMYLNLGYRFIDIRDIAVPVGFVAGGSNFKDLNALHIEIGAAIGF